jgi:hypothetical protein
MQNNASNSIIELDCYFGERYFRSFKSLIIETLEDPLDIIGN